MTEQIEEWRDIPNWEGFYQVSNTSKVKSLERFVDRNGKIIKVPERILKPTSVSGYQRVMLCRDSKMKATLIHRLVAEIFIPNPENKNTVNHKNGIKTDNRINNLEWCSSSYNSKHSYEIGLQKPKRGLLNGNAKITIDQAFNIKYNHKNMNSTQLSEIYKISRSSIKAIRNGRNWSDV